MDKFNQDQVSQATTTILTGFAQLLAAISTTDQVVNVSPGAMKIDDAAEYVGVSRNTFRKEFLNTNLIKPVEIGGNPKYLRTDLDKVLKQIARRK